MAHKQRRRKKTTTDNHQLRTPSTCGESSITSEVTEAGQSSTTPEVTETCQFSTRSEVRETSQSSTTLEVTETCQFSTTPEVTETCQSSTTPEVTETFQSSVTPEVTETYPSSTTPDVTETYQSLATPEATETCQSSKTPKITEIWQSFSSPEVAESYQPSIAPDVTCKSSTPPCKSFGAPIQVQVDSLVRVESPSTVTAQTPSAPNKSGKKRKRMKGDTKRNKYPCPFLSCSATVYHLPRHMRQRHGWAQGDANKVLNSFGLRKERADTLEKKKQKFVSKICSFPGCASVVKRIHNHLTDFHQIKRGSNQYKKLLASSLPHEPYSFGHRIIV